MLKQLKLKQATIIIYNKLTCNNNISYLSEMQEAEVIPNWTRIKR